MFFFFNDTATTEIYTLSLHDALPISLGIGEHVRTGGRQHGLGEAPHPGRERATAHARPGVEQGAQRVAALGRDRKSTRLNSSHGYISYAVFCLKKKKNYRSNLTRCRT